MRALLTKEKSKSYGWEKKKSETQTCVWEAQNALPKRTLSPLTFVETFQLIKFVFKVNKVFLRHIPFRVKLSHQIYKFEPLGNKSPFKKKNVSIPKKKLN